MFVAVLALAEAARQMNAGAWILMLGSWAILIALNVYCFRKILTKK